MHQDLPKSLVIMALFILMPFVSNASQVHKWVDENGVTHYSDQAPRQNAVHVDQFEIADVYHASDFKDDYYSISNQWARVHAERVARKKLQLEKAKLKQSRLPATPEVVYLNQDESRNKNVYYPVYRSGFSRFSNQKLRNGFRKNFNHHYSGAHCKIPRNTSYRSGLTFTIR